ncbi:long-chain fatty acid--CoA ligase [Aestuariicella sp. G3-2]|uniref:AMP-dependent synthetase/ligase n=1 Tax=Pseudomaricurvus albidus TaxID=2842452 RepID=UPI001C0BC176|nr:long-chain fatty acid--CoA ligase [Aestuariicella albida]MBU3069188.1 long-chain fatty acid--CoA ligase [Aestuariicella albida]
MNAPLATSSEARTIYDLLTDRVNTTPDNTALYYSVNDHWKNISWKEYSNRIDAVAKALLGKGLNQGDKVAIIGRNSLDWFISDMGIMTAGLVSVPIYETSSSDQIRYIIKHSSAKILFSENSSYLDRILPIIEDTPSLESIVIQTGTVDESDLIKSQVNFIANNDNLPSAILDNARQSIQPSTVAAFIYTSGTTGQPKAVMLTHQNTVAACKNVYLRLKPEWQNNEKISCSYLPLSHVAERVTSMFTPLLEGRSVYIVSDMARIMDAVKQVHPTMWMGVPRIWEKIFEGVKDQVNDWPRLKKNIFNWAIKTGSQFNRTAQDKTGISSILRLKHKLAQHLVITPLLTSLGLERVVISITGGAPSRPEIENFFSSIGLRLLQVYGQSEGYGTTSLATNSEFKAGSCGKPFPLVKIKIADDGEILVHGNNVSPGYFKEPELTKQTFKDGWLRSGDLGRLDEDGHLWVTGRKKDIIITSGGKNITPTKIENYLCESDLVNYAVVIGDGRKYLTAILDLNIDKTELSNDENSDQHKINIESKISSHVKNVNEKLSRVEQIKKHHILYNEFTLESGYLTNTMKLKRQSVLEKYEKEIIEMYED